MRPILLGMNNPYGDDPRTALYPHPPGCSGHRLWKMINNVCGMTEFQYIKAFDRRNLLIGEWDQDKAREAGKKFWVGCGSAVVVLGQKTWRAVRSSRPHSPGVGEQIGDAWWYYLPHPSGRTLWYNDARNRVLTGQLLASLVENK